MKKQQKTKGKKKIKIITMHEMRKQQKKK